MDSWSQDQLKKMQMGGNGRLNSFLRQYGVEKDMDIKDKYNSKAAEVRTLRMHAAGDEVEGACVTGLACGGRGCACEHRFCAPRWHPSVAGS